MTIKIVRPGNLQELFAKAAKDADEHGVTWTGDLWQGQAAGKGFEGSYRVDGDCITIDISKKPAWVLRGQIEKAVNSYIAQI